MCGTQPCLLRAGAHGAPIHWGSPEALGISAAELSAPHWGEAVTIDQPEVPVFWACGVTPHTAIMAARLPLAVTHAPGHMCVAKPLQPRSRANSAAVWLCPARVPVRWAGLCATSWTRSWQSKAEVAAKAIASREFHAANNDHGKRNLKAHEL